MKKLFFPIKGEKMKTTAERLKEIMEERNLRQVDILTLAKPVCEKYGGKLTRQDLSQYVSGKVEPRQDKLFILATALNVSEPWLMGYDVAQKRIYNVFVEEMGNTINGVAENGERLMKYYAEIVRKVAYLGEDARDSIIHQIEYEYDKEKRKHEADSELSTAG